MRYRVVYRNNDGNLWVGPLLRYTEAAWFYATFSNAIEVVKVATMPKRKLWWHSHAEGLT